MLILVTGKNGSGKSAFAEQLAVALGGSRYYIATMLPYGEEGAARVQKHRAQRAGLGFTTLELPFDLGGADLPRDAVVLLEDVSNLLSNAMFDKGDSKAQVLEDIKGLYGRVGCVVAVTISEFDDDGGGYSQETLRYIRSLRWLNEQLAALADTVVEMDGGVPLWRKGGPGLV